MKHQILTTAIAFALASTMAYAHHPAEDNENMPEGTWDMIDENVADTPHADMTFDDMGGAMESNAEAGAQASQAMQENMGNDAYMEAQQSAGADAAMEAHEGLGDGAYMEAQAGAEASQESRAEMGADAFMQANEDHGESASEAARQFAGSTANEDSGDMGDVRRYQLERHTGDDDAAEQATGTIETIGLMDDVVNALAD